MGHKDDITELIKNMDGDDIDKTPEDVEATEETELVGPNGEVIDEPSVDSDDDIVLTNDETDQ